MITKTTNICNLPKYFYCIYDCKHPFLGYICIQYNFTLFILLPTCLFFLYRIMKAIYGYTDYSFKYGFLGIFEEEGT